MATDIARSPDTAGLRSRLENGAAEVWWIDLEGEADPAAITQQTLLDGSERARAARFIRDRDRRSFVAAHTLLRAMLEHALGTPAAAFRFVAGARGKPGLHSPSGAPGCEFNLSHTTTAVACAVTRNHPIGVDVENRHRVGKHLELADAYFAPAETARLRRAPAAEQASLFFAQWTLKEAYVKARGEGLSLPLDQFAVDINPARISFAPGFGDDPSRWHFVSEEPDDRHTIAVAVRAPADEPRPIGLHRIRLADLVSQPRPLRASASTAG